MGTSGPVVLELTGERTPVRVLLRDAVRARGLVLMLARQDFAARYRSAVLGLSWTVALPLLQAAVLAVVFTRFVRIETPVPYAAFVLVGITMWAYVSTSVGAASTSVVDGGALATKLWFPRLVLPAVTPTANLVGLGIGLVLAVVVSAVLGEASVTVLALPLAVVLAYAFVVVLSALAALAHVWFRDVRYLVSAVLLVAFYGTPVIYPLERAGALEPLVTANPATGLVELTRWCVFGESEGLPLALAWTGGWLVVLTVATVLAYARHERTACDRL